MGAGSPRLLPQAFRQELMARPKVDWSDFRHSEYSEGELWFQLKGMQMRKLNGSLPGWKNCQTPLLSLVGLLMLMQPNTLPASAAAPPAAQVTVLTQWKYDPKLNRLEIAVRDAITPRYFLLAQPARIILDLPNTEIGKVETQKTYTGVIRQIRVSQFQPGLTRIVMELSPNVELAAPQVKLQPANAKGSSSRAWVLQPLLAKASAPTVTPASVPQRSVTQSPVPQPSVSQSTVVPSTSVPPETAVVVPVSPLAQPSGSTPAPAALPALPPSTPRVTPPVPPAAEPALPPAILPSTTAVTVQVPSAPSPPAIAQPTVPPNAGVVGGSALPYGTPLPPATPTATIPPGAARVPALPPALPARANPPATPQILIFGQPLPKPNTPR